VRPEFDETLIILDEQAFSCCNHKLLTVVLIIEASYYTCEVDIFRSFNIKNH